MENKKGFILYADQRFVFDKLPNDKAGELIKHIFSYVNDEQPEPVDLLLDVAFEPIRQNLKRDLEKRKDMKIKRSEAGKKGGAPKGNSNAEKGFNTKTSKTSNGSKKQAKQAVNVIVNDNVSVKEKEILAKANTTESFGNTDINNLLGIIKKFNNGICDGTQKEQRQYGKTLIGKLKKIDKIEDGEYTREKYLIGLLEVVSKSSHHSHKISGPKKIYYDLAGLIMIANQTMKKNKVVTIPGIS